MILLESDPYIEKHNGSGEQRHSASAKHGRQLSKAREGDERTNDAGLLYAESFLIHKLLPTFPKGLPREQKTVETSSIGLWSCDQSASRF